MMDALEEFPRFACKKNTEKNSIKHMSMLCHKILSKFDKSQGPATKFSGKIFLTSRNINPFAPEPPVTARADPRPFYPL